MRTSTSAQSMRHALAAARAADHPQNFYDAEKLIGEAARLALNATTANFTTIQAKSLLNQALSAYNTAVVYFSQGDYDAAKVYAQTAIEFFKQAFQAEQESKEPVNRSASYYMVLGLIAVLAGLTAAFLIRRRRKKADETR